MTYTASAERSEPEGHNVLVPTEYQVPNEKPAEGYDDAEDSDPEPPFGFDYRGKAGVGAISAQNASSKKTKTSIRMQVDNSKGQDSNTAGTSANTNDTKKKE